MTLSSKDNLRNLLIRFGYNTKPNFMIVGAQKAGTTSLHGSLVTHSFIKSAAQKELHFFDDDNFDSKHLTDYLSHFPLPHNVNKGTIYFEATPDYLYHPDAARRLYDFDKTLKLIVVLRQPSYRALSAWIMHHVHFKNSKYHTQFDPRSFTKAIEEELNTLHERSIFKSERSYIKRGLYAEQLEQYYKYFPVDNILILESNALKNEFESTSIEIQEFLELPIQSLRPKALNKSALDKTSEYKRDLEFLNSFYEPENERLFSLIGRRFEW